MSSESPKLLTDLQLIIFDFDCTITKFHLADLKLEEILNQPTDKFIESALFVSFAKYLKNLQIKIAIASYGKKSIILSLLNRLSPDLVFKPEEIVTPLDISLSMKIPWKEGFNPPKGKPVNKNNMIQLIAERNQTPLEKICLIDDNEIHIKNAKELGCQAFLATKSQLKETLSNLAQRFKDPFLETLENF